MSGRSPVYVWRIDLAASDSDVDLAAGWLTDAERARAVQGVSSVRRRRVLLRAALRLVLGDVLGLRPGAVPLVVDRGRPRLSGSAPAMVEFSCSAGGEVGLVAVGRGARLGVDVERHRDAEAGAAVDEGWLTADERRALDQLDDHRRLQATTRCWTQKEAVLKGRGIGVRQTPASIGTPVADSGWIGNWWVTSVSVPTRHLASLAVENPAPVPDVRMRDLTVGGPR